MDAINCTDFIEYIVQKLKSSLREFCLKKAISSLGSADNDPTHPLPNRQSAMIESDIKANSIHAI